MTRTRPPHTAADLGFREVLGHYPTGVVVVAALDAAGGPAGMTIGSFTSVSLDPPLIAFMPGRGSRTFARLRTASSFCVNVLAADQEWVCRRFSGGAGFADVAWTPAPSGAPVIDGAVAWIDCRYHDLLDAGDHYLALGRVTRFEVARPVQPLLFFQGGYGRFTPTSLTALPESDLIEGVRLAELARPEMDALARSLGVECSLLSAAGGDLVTVGVATAPGRPAQTPTGGRIPLRAPLGDLYVAWQGPEVVERWLDGAGTGDPAVRERYRRRLELARTRGWSMSLAGPHVRHPPEQTLRQYSSGDLTPAARRRLEREIAEMAQAYEPVELVPGRRYDVRSLVAPVFGRGGEVLLVLRLSRLPGGATAADVAGWLERLTAAAARLSASAAAPA